MKLLIVGCGYVGLAFRNMVPNDWSVYALTRTDARNAEFRQAAIEPLVGDWLVEESLRNLPEVDLVLVSVPHRPDPELQERTHQVGLRNLLTKLPGGWKKLIYLSTTGVYGDCENEVVDEQTPVAPTRIGPAIAVEGETWLRRQVPTEKLVTLRLAGIYGPGRIPLAAKLKEGHPLSVPQQGFLNLVHVGDIARLVLRLMTVAMQQNLYVFSDGMPVARLEFYTYLARLCGVEKPQFIDPEPTDSRARRATSKRVDPSRIVRELRFEYRFPDYRTGLVDALGGNDRAMLNEKALTGSPRTDSN